jgi:hypothetical protein
MPAVKAWRFFRPEFTSPWVGRPQVTLLSLSRLPPRQRAEMITHVTGGKALPKEITALVANISHAREFYRLGLICLRPPQNRRIVATDDS